MNIGLILKKVFYWIFILVIGLIIILFVGIEVVDRYLSSERGTKWLFSETPQKESLKIKFTLSGTRYVVLGDRTKPALMLVHGAPGSVMDWVAFAKRSQIYDFFHLIIPDRPGYGGTKPRGAEPSLRTQANLLLDILEEEDKNAVVLGHSYGGPIAVAMGGLDTNRVEKIVGVSGQYMPENEIIFSISYFIKFKIFKYLLPRMIWVANEEKMNHPDALRSVQALFFSVKQSTILIHGNKDSLVLYENSVFLKDQIGDNASLITMEGYDHPVHMQATDLLIDLTLRALGKIGD